MKKSMLIVSLCLLVVFSACAGSKSVDPVLNDDGYDQLQALYLEIDSSMSYSRILGVVKASGLYYTEEDTATSVTLQIALAERTALSVLDSKYESGDFVRVKFDKNVSNNFDARGANYSSCQYSKAEKAISLFDYTSGYFGAGQVSNAGLYITNLQEPEESCIEFPEGSGNTRDRYVPFDKSGTKHDQMEYLLNYEREW